MHIGNCLSLYTAASARSRAQWVIARPAINFKACQLSQLSICGHLRGAFRINYSKLQSQKPNRTSFSIMKKLTAITLSLLLAACGGGGSSSSPATTQLSADQTIFEALVLAPNASYSPNWRLPLSGAPVSTTHYLYAYPLSLLASPLVHGAQSPSFGNVFNIANNLPASSPSNVTRYLVSGSIFTDASSIDRYSYSGTGVRRDTLAANGVTLLASQVRSNFQSVNLSGLISSSPVDLKRWFNALFTNTALLTSPANWVPVARYVSYNETALADIYRVFDSSAVTTDTNPSPLASTTTIAALMTAGGISSVSDSATYTLSNGAISTVNGIRTYTASILIPQTTTNRYRTYYEINGNVYEGDLVRTNTLYGGASFSETIGGVTTTNYSSRVQLRFNRAVMDNLNAAVTF